MKKTFFRVSAATVPVLTILLTVSCNISQEVVLNHDLSGNIQMTGEAMDFAAPAFDDMAFLAGFDDAGALYDNMLAQTETEMTKREDLSGFSSSRTGPQSWNAETGFDDLRTLLGSTEAGGIVDYGTSGGISSLSLRFDRESAGEFRKLIPLFDNPSFELFDPTVSPDLDEESYIQNVLGFSFGPENIPGIREATVRLALELPGTVTSVSGGEKVSDTKVIFEMPLTRLLIPDPPITWSVSWR